MQRHTLTRGQRIISRTSNGAVYHTEAFYDATDVVEKTYASPLIGIYLHVADDIAATIVVTFKALYAGSDGCERLAIQVDVSHLLDMDFAVLGHLDILIDRLQVSRGFHLERRFFCSLTCQIYYACR